MNFLTANHIVINGPDGALAVPAGEKSKGGSVLPMAPVEDSARNENDDEDPLNLEKFGLTSSFGKVMNKKIMKGVKRREISRMSTVAKRSTSDKAILNRLQQDGGR